MEFLQVASAFAFGVLAGGNPCTLPLFPGFIAYLTHGSDALKERVRVYLIGPLVLAGTLSSMLLVGGVAAGLGQSVSIILSQLDPAIYGLLAILGLYMLFGWKLKITMPGLAYPSAFRNTYLQAYVYGLLYGPISLPCTLPLVLSVTVLSISYAEAIGRMLVFIVYGFGMGLPLLILSSLANIRQKWLIRQIASRHQVATKAAGVLLVAVGIYGIVMLPALF